MPQPDHLESTGDAVSETPLNQKRCGPEDDDPQGHPSRRVLVPEPLDDLRPVGNLLDLVEDEHGTALLGGGENATDLPLGDAAIVNRSSQMARYFHCRRAIRALPL